MKYRIAGADSITGADRKVEVEADSEKDAVRAAKQQGVLAFKVASAPASPPEPPAQPLPLSGLERQRRRQWVVAFCGGAVAILVLLTCSGFFSSRSGSDVPPPSYQYEESPDRDLKKLPSLQGYSESEKQQIISAAKKLDAAIKESERQRDR